MAFGIDSSIRIYTGLPVGEDFVSYSYTDKVKSNHSTETYLLVDIGHSIFDSPRLNTINSKNVARHHTLFGNMRCWYPGPIVQDTLEYDRINWVHQRLLKEMYK